MRAVRAHPGAGSDARQAVQLSGLQRAVEAHEHLGVPGQLGDVGERRVVDQPVGVVRREQAGPPRRCRNAGSRRAAYAGGAGAARGAGRRPGSAPAGWSQSRTRRSGRGTPPSTTTRRSRGSGCAAPASRAGRSGRPARRRARPATGCGRGSRPRRPRPRAGPRRSRSAGPGRPPPRPPRAGRARARPRRAPCRSSASPSGPSSPRASHAVTRRAQAGAKSGGVTRHIIARGASRRRTWLRSSIGCGGFDRNTEVTRTGNPLHARNTARRAVKPATTKVLDNAAGPGNDSVVTPEAASRSLFPMEVPWTAITPGCSWRRPSS